MEFIQIGPAMVHPVRGYLLVTRFWKLSPRIYNRNREEFLPKYLPDGVSSDAVIRAKEYAFPFIINYPAMHLDIAMHTEIKQGRGTEHGGVYMDVSHNSAEQIENTVPVTFKWLLDRGIDIRKQPIEIAPLVQCFIGGVRYNDDAATDVPGLFVCGEVSGGAHGAARPGGNLLAISQVFGRIAGNSAAKRAKPINRVNLDEAQLTAEVERLNGLLAPGGESAKVLSTPLKKLLWDNVCCVRNHDGLTAVLGALCVANTKMPQVRAGNVQQLREALEFQYLLDTAEMVTRAALARDESRGTHYREDAPKPNNYRWLKNINIRMVDGAMKLSLARPVTIPDFEACEEEELYNG
jgi:fumarate reductase (CoM/CoB) subunit A